MIIVKTPFRISFFGGGTDYPDWYLRHGGQVLSTSINKYCYVSLRNLPPFFDHKFRICYSKVEHVSSVCEIQHRAIKAILNDYSIKDGLEIHCDADLPAQSGIGSSSTFAVCLAHALDVYSGKVRSKMELAEYATYVERELLGDTVGVQDQLAAAVGGLNHFEFARTGDIKRTPVAISAERLRELESHLMLFFTGFSRSASLIASKKVSSFEEKQDELIRIGEFVDEGLDLLKSETSMTEFGRLMDEAWKFKRSISKAVSTPEVDEMYDLAIRAGAIGGKLIGAGGGGFLLLVVPQDSRCDVSKALKDLIHVPFETEHNGSQILVYER